jgi:hypothetical protein
VRGFPRRAPRAASPRPRSHLNGSPSPKHETPFAQTARIRQSISLQRSALEAEQHMLEAAALAGTPAKDAPVAPGTGKNIFARGFFGVPMEEEPAYGTDRGCCSGTRFTVEEYVLSTLFPELDKHSLRNLGRLDNRFALAALALVKLGLTLRLSLGTASTGDDGGGDGAEWGLVAHMFGWLSGVGVLLSLAVGAHCALFSDALGAASRNGRARALAAPPRDRGPPTSALRRCCSILTLTAQPQNRGTAWRFRLSLVREMDLSIIVVLLPDLMSGAATELSRLTTLVDGVGLKADLRICSLALISLCYLGAALCCSRQGGGGHADAGSGACVGGVERLVDKVLRTAHVVFLVLCITLPYIPQAQSPRLIRDVCLPAISLFMVLLLVVVVNPLRHMILAVQTFGNDTVHGLALEEALQECAEEDDTGHDLNLTRPAHTRARRDDGRLFTGHATSRASKGANTTRTKVLLDPSNHANIQFDWTRLVLFHERFSKAVTIHSRQSTGTGAQPETGPRVGSRGWSAGFFGR